MQNDNFHPDVVIVGGGMVGSALACALAETGCQLLLIESQPIESILLPNVPEGFDARVSALNLATQRFLDHLGAWQAIAAKRASPYRHMCVWDAEGTGEIHFDAQSLGFSALGHIVENRFVVNGLFERVNTHKNIRLETGVALEQLNKLDDGWEVRLSNGEAYSAGLIVGADGGRSQVRGFAGIDCNTSDYEQQAIVTTVKTAQPNQATAWQRFLSTGPLAFLPLDHAGDRSYSSIVWSLDKDQVAPLMEKSDEAFRQALSEAFEYRLGAVVEIDKRVAFPLQYRHAKSYIAEGLALVGDAAHTIHPLAGQGVNLGFMDAAVLAEEIVYGLKKGLAPGHATVLSRYQRRRRGQNMLMGSMMTGFKSLFGETALPLRWLRSSGMNLVNQLAPVKEKLVAQAMGIEGDLPEAAKAAR